MVWAHSFGNIFQGRKTEQKSSGEEGGDASISLER